MASTNLKTLPKGPATAGQAKASKGPWPKGFIVVALVPAHDEVQYIDNVAKQLNQRRREGLIHEVVVVNDGSTDKTAKHAKNWNATVVELPENRGKATAIAAGARYVTNKYVPKAQFPPGKKRYDKMEKVIVVMIDADMGTISKGHIHGLVDPIVRDHELNMTVGKLARHSKYIMDNKLSGQRGIRLRSLGALVDETTAWKKILTQGYGLETALNKHIKSAQFTKIKFDTKRGPGGKAGRKLIEEIFRTAKYLNARRNRAKRLRTERSRKKPKKPH